MGSASSENKIRILHVDDEPDMLKFTKTFLERENPSFNITSTPSPIEALIKIKQQEFACIISDYKMHQLTGIQMAERIREFSDIPILLYTGQGSEEVAEHAFQIGIDDYIRKELEPAHYQVLARRITSAVERKNAENARATRESWLNAFMNSTTDGFSLLDSEFRYLAINNYHLNQLGLERDDIIGKHVSEIRPNFTKTGRYKKYLEVLKTGETYRELISVMPSGRRNIELKIFKVLEGLGVVTTDLNKIIESELALTITEEKYRRLFEEAIDAIFVAEVESGIIIDCNDAACQLVERLKEELIGQHQSILHPTYVIEEGYSETFRQHVGEKSGEVLQTDIITKNGAIKQVSIKANVFELDGKKIIQGFFHDISEQQRILRQLQSNEERLENFLNSATDGFTLFDPKFNYKEINQTTLDRMGLQKEDVIGKNVLDLYPEVETSGRLDIYRKVIETGESIVLDNVTVNRILGKRVFTIKAFKVGDGLGLIATDKTDQTLMEDRLAVLLNHSMELRSAQSMDDVAKWTFNQLSNIMNVQIGSFHIVEPGFVVPIYSTFSGVNELVALPLDGPGIVARAVRTGKTQLVKDTRLDNDYIPVPTSDDLLLLSELVVPVKIDDEVVAVINIESPLLNAFDEQDIILVETMAIHVSSAISKLNQIEELKKSEEKHRNLLESGIDGVTVNSAGELLFVNQRFVDMIRYSREELREISSVELHAPEYREYVQEVTQRRQEGEPTVDRYEVELIRKDGTRVPVEYAVSFIDYEGKPSSLTYIRDITDRKTIEERLEALHTHAYRLAQANDLTEIAKKTFEAIHSVLGFNLGGFYLVESDIRRVIHAEGFIGREVYPLDGEGIINQAIRQGKSLIVKDTRLEKNYLVPLNAKKPLLSELAVPVKVNNKVLALINIESGKVNAFSEQDKKIAEILAQHVVSAMGRIELRSQFEQVQEKRVQEIFDGINRSSSMIRHDLRSPLMNIQNAANLIQTDRNLVEDMLEIINRNISYADKILEDWRRVSIFELPVRSTVNINELINEAVSTITVYNLILVNLNVDPNLIFSLDRNKMLRVLVNIIKNSTEAIPEKGEIRIIAKIEKNNLVITISDTGKGMDETAQSKLFTPFFTTKPDGIGLGLAFCKQTIEAHDGTIQVESEQGKGTTIQIKIPGENN